MDLQTLDVDKAAARAAFLDYRRAFQEEHRQIDGELMRGYKAIAGGKTLISLSATIRAGGADDQGRPRLCVARADESRISFSRTQHGAVTFSPNISWGDRARSVDRVLSLGDGTLPDAHWIQSGTWLAIMPLIPPKFRPPYNLENYHVLWEPVWTRPTTRRAPGDPALLRRIGGDLFAVLAIWDLSPLEKAVLELRG